MIPIIITGHGKFASAMKETIEYIFVEQSNLYFIDFDNGMSRQELKNEFERVIKKIDSDEIIFLTDLLGGTPFLLATSLIKENLNYRVFSGCNVAMIIATIELSNQKNIEMIEEKILEYAQDGIVVFKKSK